jgi:HD-GYP domain-containing protein (c-di-GMP phosphodiesterase class II)
MAMNEEVQKLKQLVELDADLQRIQDVDILLEKILTHARRYVRADAGTIYLRQENELHFRHAQNDTKTKQLPPGQKLIYSFFTIDINRESIAGYVADTKEILNIPNVYEIPAGSSYSFNPSYDKVSQYKSQSMLTIPLITNLGEVLGVIQVINAQDERGQIVPFNKSDEMYVKHFANNATIALQRAQLTRQILLRMISMAELRDPKETGAHVNRVASYAVELYERWATHKRLSMAEIEKNRDLLRMAAMLHDVGKVGVSDIILKKNGRLTDVEYEIIKSHSYYGARLFSARQSEFDEVACAVSLTHHENWDGTGYPGHVDIATGQPLEQTNDGRPRPRKGEEIPIFGRVVAIADVFDALSSKRVYKEAWQEADVLKEMRQLSGKKFDPELVDIFFEAYDHLKEILHKYPE